LAPLTCCAVNGDLGVDLMQLIVAPTVAFKIAPNHSVGISPLIGLPDASRHRACKLFGGISSDPTALTNNGHDGALGFGVRVGYLGKITPTVTIGAAYASKISMDEFDDYAGLFAEQGDFDIPENCNLGVSWQATPQLRLAMRLPAHQLFRRQLDQQCQLGSRSPLGADNGPGFGWSDVDVWKLGVEYKHNPAWTYRAGYSHARQPDFVEPT
jgi:long-chain fatty acid transport protein